MFVRFNNTERDRGAALVEYAMLVALIAVVLMVSINLISGKLGDTFTQTANDLDNGATIEASGSSGTSGSNATSGTSGSNGVTTTTAATTTTVPPTTTTVAPTTTVPPTTTTVAPTTTTAAQSGSSASQPSQGGTVYDQSKTASYDDEFDVTFGAVGNTISITGVDAGNWTYEIVKNVNRKLKVKFTSKDGEDVVLVEAKIDKRGKLKTKVKTLK